MLLILGSLFAGITLGYLVRNKQKLLNLADHLSMISLYLLLFALGLSIGMSKEIIAGFAQIGFKALVITISAITMSVILSGILFRTMFRK